jgi:5-(carboxyamino)imidazole ribonucleotide mutase
MSKQVAIVMGSDSDWPVMQEAAAALDSVGIEYEVNVVSAHRTPEEMLSFAKGAKENGFKVVIAGAGGAAHLPGMIAAATTLPVIGVPVPLKHLDGMDSLLSIVQMPAGIPVATVGIGNAKNAGLLAARILGVSDLQISEKVSGLMAKAREESLEKGANLNSKRNTRAGF